MSYIKPFSYNDFLTYKIQDGDTPESVAEKLDIDLYTLRSYHNRYCESVEDCIGSNFPNHLEYLIIQSEEEKKEKEAYREKIHFSTKDFRLPFLPARLDKKYLAMYEIESGSEKHSVKEELSVKWLATDTNNYSLIEIDRKAIYINDNYSKNVSEELAEKTAAIFYPLQTVVDPDGKWVGIYNFDAIRDRWYKIKRNILEEFNGKAVVERLKAFENKLEHSDIITESFSYDWFLRAFFNGINVEYKEELTFQNIIRFPVSQKIGEAKFLVEQKILPAVDKYNLVNITQKGLLSDNRSKNDFENGFPFSQYDSEVTDSEKVQGTFEAYYFLDPNTNTIESLFLECEIKLNVPQKVTITISNLDEQGKLTLATGNDLYISEESKSQKGEHGLLWVLIVIVVILILAIYGVIKFYF